jgi:hypothetical protein
MAEELREWDMRRHEALKAWLSGQSVSVLVELLMETARNDDTVRVVLRCLTERGSAGRVNGDSLREATRFLTCLPEPGEDPTCQSDRIQHRLNWMLFLLGATLNGKNPEGLVEAVELALEGSEILAMEDLDSEYWANSVRGELLRLHRLACDRTQPDRWRSRCVGLGSDESRNSVGTRTSLRSTLISLDLRVWRLTSSPCETLPPESFGELSNEGRRRGSVFIHRLWRQSNAKPLRVSA